MHWLVSDSGITEAFYERLRGRHVYDALFLHILTERWLVVNQTVKEPCRVSASKKICQRFPAISK